MSTYSLRVSGAFILSAMSRESSHTTEMHKLLRKETDLHVLRFVLHVIRVQPLR